MSASKVKPEFREPREENQYISYDERHGCIIAHAMGSRKQGAVDAQNKILLEYDKAIKERFGAEHFHGEEGMPLAMPVRVAMGWC